MSTPSFEWKAQTWAAMGFADPVFESQEAFRTILHAMAYPGRRTSLKAPPTVPHGINPAAWVILLTLGDSSVRLWMDLPRNHEACRAAQQFCHVSMVPDPESADFILVTQPSQLKPPYRFCIGTELEPERGASIIMQVSSMSISEPSSAESVFMLSGPGIPETSKVTLQGCPFHFWEWRLGLEHVYPRGVDLFLTEGNSLVCIPRSVCLTPAKGVSCTLR